jgi:hypothetical protein
MNPDVVKAVVDGVFTELELLTATRPFIHMGVQMVHAFVDQALLARVAAKLSLPASAVAPTV